jgi:hypothetical protein
MIEEDVSWQSTRSNIGSSISSSSITSCCASTATRRCSARRAKESWCSTIIGWWQPTGMGLRCSGSSVRALMNGISGVSSPTVSQALRINARCGSMAAVFFTAASFDRPSVWCRGRRDPDRERVRHSNRGSTQRFRRRAIGRRGSSTRTSRFSFRARPASVKRYLRVYEWPGNFRQLVGTLRALQVLVDPEEPLRPEGLPPEIRDGCRWPVEGIKPSRIQPGLASRLEEATKETMRQALLACDGNVSEAARRLGVSRSTIYRRLIGGRMRS